MSEEEFAYLFIHSFVRPFVRSFIHSFIQLYECFQRCHISGIFLPLHFALVGPT